MLYELTEEPLPTLGTRGSILDLLCLGKTKLDWHQHGGQGIYRSNLFPTKFLYSRLSSLIFSSCTQGGVSVYPENLFTFHL